MPPPLEYLIMANSREKQEWGKGRCFAIYVTVAVAGGEPTSSVLQKITPSKTVVGQNITFIYGQNEGHHAQTRTFRWSAAKWVELERGLCLKFLLRNADSGG